MPPCSRLCMFFTLVVSMTVLSNLPQIIILFLSDEVIRAVMIEMAAGGARVAEDRRANRATTRSRTKFEKLEGAKTDGTADGASTNDDDEHQRFIKTAAQAQLAFGLQTLSLSTVDKALKNGADPNKGGDEGSGCPLYQIASRKMPSEFTVVKDVAIRLLSEPTIEPNGDGASWTPLKTAMSNRNLLLFDELLAHPLTIPEVEISGLDCGAAKITSHKSFKFYIPDSSAARKMPSCFTSLPPDRLVNDADSQLHAFNNAQQTRRQAEAVYKKHLEQQAQHRQAKRTDGANNNEGSVGGEKEGAAAQQKQEITLGEMLEQVQKLLNDEDDAGARSSNKPATPSIDPRNPFITLPEGMLPPRDTVVMNPSPFNNIVGASLYYFFGPRPAEWIVWLMLTAVFGAFTLLSLTIRQVWSADKQRVKLAADAEAELKRQKVAQEAEAAAKRKQAEEEEERAKGGENTSEQSLGMREARANVGDNQPVDSPQSQSVVPNTSATSSPVATAQPQQDRPQKDSQSKSSLNEEAADGDGAAAESAIFTGVTATASAASPMSDSSEKTSNPTANPKRGAEQSATSVATSEAAQAERAGILLAETRSARPVGEGGGSLAVNAEIALGGEAEPDFFFADDNEIAEFNRNQGNA